MTPGHLGSSIHSNGPMGSTAQMGMQQQTSSAMRVRLHRHPEVLFTTPCMHLLAEALTASRDGYADCTVRTSHALAIPGKEGQ